MTEQDKEDAIAKRRTEIGKLHPTVEDILELLCASGRGCVNALHMAVTDKEAFAKKLQEEGGADAIKRLIGFLQSTISCAEPLVNVELGKSKMLAIMLQAEMASAEQQKKKEGGE